MYVNVCCKGAGFLRSLQLFYWSILSPFLGICESSKSQALAEVETAESANLVKSWPFPYYKTMYGDTLWVP